MAKDNSKYRKMDPITHVIERSSVYCGSRKNQIIEDHVVSIDYDAKNFTVKRESMPVPPAMLRCYLEILYNATDNKERDSAEVKQTEIAIAIAEDGLITIKNDGAVIPIEMNETENVYNHTLIFGTLLTGSNYDDEEERTTVGQNGMGAKLTNIFSKRFTVVGVDPERHLRFEQTWENSMRDTKGPRITKSVVKKGYTEISFAFDMDLFETDTNLPVDLFARYALDSAMTTGLKVVFNGVRLSSKPETYLSMISGETSIVKVSSDEYLKVWVTAADPNVGFEQISFVNGLRTRDGGKHVEAAVEAVCRPIISKLKIKITLREIKRLIRILVVAVIKNPEFNGQEKHCLTNPSVKLAPISPAMIAKIMKLTDSSGRQLESLLKSSQDDKDKKVLSKKIASKSLAIDGYDRANYAGTSKSAQCTLFVCEGKSAKPLVVKGIEYGLYGRKGRDFFGVFPLTGKILNTRNASTTAVAKNTVITNLAKIIGLDFAKPDNLSNMNYGKICILADADVDGLHIEGLLMNFFHSCFPLILEKRMVSIMRTPIVQVGKKFFYSMRDENIKEGKYLKGLGTIKPSDVEAVFGKKILQIKTDEKIDETFDCAFGATRSTERKRWIAEYDPAVEDGNQLLNSPDVCHIDYPATEHLETQVIKYFVADCVRSLPHIPDGLKESQRKIIHAMGALNMVKSQKVERCAPAIAVKCQYGHGEANLCKAIIAMACDFVGSGNNVPLLEADGVFGTRNAGGDDAASPRYIQTCMKPVCTRLFPSSDHYEPLYYEGEPIEPQYFVPVLPVLLLNGCLGIASGWMCSCPSFNPIDVIENARRAIHGETELLPIKPWYNGFIGDVVDLGKGKFETRGIYDIKKLKNGNRVITITELPIGLWTDDFNLICAENENIVKIRNQSTTTKIFYELEVDADFDDKKFMKKVMSTTMDVNNIVGFDTENNIVKVTVEEVFRIWAEARLKKNQERKSRLLKEFKEKENYLRERIKFITLVRDKTLILTSKEETLIKEMAKNGISNTDLLNLSLRQLTEEKKNECKKKLDIVVKDIETLTKMSLIEMWEADLLKVKEVLKL